MDKPKKNIDAMLNDMREEPMKGPVNYAMLEGEFVTGAYDTVVAFAKAKGIDHRVLRQYSKGWAAKRKTYIQNTTEMIMEHDMEHKLFSGVQVNYILCNMMMQQEKQYEELAAEYKRLNEIIASQESVGSKELEGRDSERVRGRLNKALDQMRAIEKATALLAEKYWKHVGKGSLAEDEAKEEEIRAMQEQMERHKLQLTQHIGLEVVKSAKKEANSA